MPDRMCRLAVLLLAMSWGVAFAEEEVKEPEKQPAKEAPKDAKPSDQPPPIAPCLDDENAFLGVQAKTFLKRHRLEIVGQGGIYASDLLSSTYTFGGAAAFYITEDIGFEGLFAVAPIALDVDKSLSNFFGDTRFREETGYLILAGLLWSPIHYKIKAPGGGILHGDIELALGGGRMLSKTSQGFAFHAGVLMDFYLTKWLSLRIDIRDIMLIQEVVGETRLTNNIIALGGIALWVPFGF